MRRELEQVRQDNENNKLVLTDKIGEVKALDKMLNQERAHNKIDRTEHGNQLMEERKQSY